MVDAPEIKVSKVPGQLKIYQLELEYKTFLEIKVSIVAQQLKIFLV